MLIPFIIFFLLFSIPAGVAAPLSDEELLNTIQKQSLDFFVKERNPDNGLVADRAHNFHFGAKQSSASIASTGFGLATYAVAVERNWLDYQTARDMTFKTLEFFWITAPQEHGFFYHFLNKKTGQRVAHSEVSPIDSALLLAGAMFAAEYFNDSAIRDLANKIYSRMDWPWLLHGGETLVLAWSPEEGFHKNRWDQYNESMIMYLFAIGSPTHPIPASSWHAITRTVGSYGPFRSIQMPPLFTHQYSHIWVNFKNKNDGHADYFQNSVNATLANRAFCMDQSKRFSTYGPNSWGLTACDGPFGYRAYGAPPGWADHDGTIAPTACGSSIPFTPKESIECLRYFYEKFRDSLWGLYGFSDAFNVDRKWFDKEVVGIDQGALFLMIENYRSGLIWKKMDKNLNIKNAMKDVGFKEGTMELPWPDPPTYHAPYVFGGITVDGYLKDWPNAESIILEAKSDKDLKAKIHFAWDENALYFYAEVEDNQVIRTRKGKNIWQDDLLEMYVDPQGDGLYWYNAKDFQMGFHPSSQEGIDTWSWFQGGEDPSKRNLVAASGFTYPTGYLIEGAIQWSYLSVHPEKGAVVRLSPIIHDIDRNSENKKKEWFFRNEEKLQRFVLGEIILEKNDK